METRYKIAILFQTLFSAAVENLYIFLPRSRNIKQAENKSPALMRFSDFHANFNCTKQKKNKKKTIARRSTMDLDFSWTFKDYLGWFFFRDESYVSFTICSLVGDTGGTAGSRPYRRIRRPVPALFFLPCSSVASSSPLLSAFLSFLAFFVRCELVFFFNPA